MNGLSFKALSALIAGTLIVILIVGNSFASGWGWSDHNSSAPRSPEEFTPTPRRHPDINWEKRSRLMQWTVGREPYGRAVEIFAVPGFCIGRPRPRFGRIRIDEAKRRVTIFAHVIVFQTPGKGEACKDVASSISKRVMLKRAVGERALFDGSIKPPARRWPR
jgi:hypothetical protein